MTAESMLAKRPILRFTVTLLFLLSYFRPVFIFLPCNVELLFFIFHSIQFSVFNLLCFQRFPPNANLSGLLIQLVVLIIIGEIVVVFQQDGKLLRT